MNIHQKITCQFTAIVAVLMLCVLLIIYILFSSLRHEEFGQRLASKAKSIGQLIAQTENIDPALLEKIEKNNPTSLPKEKVIVFNASGKIIFKSGNYKSITITDSLLQKIKDEQEIRYKQAPYEIFAFYYNGAKEHVIVICAATDVFGLRELKNLGIILTTVFLVGLILVYYLGRLFAAKALAPISQVVEQVNEIDISNMSTRVRTVNEKDEIGTLSETFNKMLDRLESSFKIQKDFITNSSHELRTPLTAITGQLEVTLLQERSIEEYKDAILSVLEDIKKLNQLANRLLTLSRAGSDFTADGFNTQRIDDILWKARSEILKRHKKYIIGIHFDESINDEHHLNVDGNEQLLQTAFMNLIENGCKYSPDHKTDIFLTSYGNYIEINFKDNGIGIPEHELNLVFQPFYRAENVKKNRGHGIGLSLVDKIITLHNGSIKVVSRLKKGSEFRLKFPLAN
jgi:signal transduction histidine kinase